MIKYSDLFTEAYKAYCKENNIEYKTPDFQFMEEGAVSVDNKIYLGLGKDLIFITEIDKEPCFFNLKTHQLEHHSIVLC